MGFLRGCLWQNPNAEAHHGSDSAGSASSGGRQDGLLWYKDIGRHVYGDFSMAMIQANSEMEDHGQIESGSLSTLDSGPFVTFVGIYDGHGGADTARFINYNLFNHLERFFSEHQSISVDAIRRAVQATEEGFLTVVSRQWPSKPHIAAVGSCCLFGVVCDGTLFIANLGDSRAVLGRLAMGGVQPVQLSAEHNASVVSERRELQCRHPDDPHVVVTKHNVWRVKGILQVTRSIGDFYLKLPEYNREPLSARFLLPGTFRRPILSTEPSVTVHALQPQDQFIIFASDGLWEHLTNQEAADIVHRSSHNGIARKLVKAALKEAAKKREMRYSDLKELEGGIRRHFHDDITVVVLFLDSNIVSRAATAKGPRVSLKGGSTYPPSNSRTSMLSIS